MARQQLRAIQRGGLDAARDLTNDHGEAEPLVRESGRQSSRAVPEDCAGACQERIQGELRVHRDAQDLELTDSADPDGPDGAAPAGVYGRPAHRHCSGALAAVLVAMSIGGTESAQASVGPHHPRLVWLQHERVVDELQHRQGGGRGARRGALREWERLGGDLAG
eukprot:4380602-Pyramimonas_sp.AAC.1